MLEQDRWRAPSSQPQAAATELWRVAPTPRIDRLRMWMEAHKVDRFIGLGPANVNYLAGYQRYYGSPAAVVVAPDGERTLFVTPDEQPVAEKLADVDAVCSYGERGFGLNLRPHDDLFACLAKAPVLTGATRIAVGDDGNSAPAKLSRQLSAPVIAGDDGLLSLRLIKDEDELQRILWAYELSWVGQEAIAERLAAGVSEIELFCAAGYAVQIAHGAPVDFSGDVFVGPSTAKVCAPVHVSGTQQRAHVGDAALADLVVGADGYFGDTAETHVCGENDQVSDIRRRLLDVLRSSAAALVPGNTAASVFQTMAERIRAEFPGAVFPHHGGHGIGLTPFESPHIIPTDTTALEKFMVIALEPGVYFEEEAIGVRVENVFVVGPRGGAELRTVLGADGPYSLGDDRLSPGGPGRSASSGDVDEQRSLPPVDSSADRYPRIGAEAG